MSALISEPPQRAPARAPAMAAAPALAARRRRGRPSVLTPERQAAMLRFVAAGLSAADAAEAVGISRATIARLLADPRHAAFRRALSFEHGGVSLAIVAGMVQASRRSTAMAILWLQMTDPLTYGPIRGPGRRARARAALQPPRTAPDSDGLSWAALAAAADADAGAEGTGPPEEARPRGRPRVMTTERQERVLHAVRVGATKGLAAAYAGVGESTLLAFLADPPNRPFARALAQAHATVELFVLTNLTRLTRRSSRAGLFLLDLFGSPDWQAADPDRRERPPADRPRVPVSPQPMPADIAARITAATEAYQRELAQESAPRPAPDRERDPAAAPGRERGDRPQR